jgi:hypothetical protein
VGARPSSSTKLPEANVQVLTVIVFPDSGQFNATA